MWDFLCSHAAEIFGVILGIIYLIFELKAWWPMWIVSIIMPINSLFVYFKAGLYADFAIDIYYVLAAVYGLAVWLSSRRPLPPTPADSSLSAVPADRSLSATPADSSRSATRACVSAVSAPIDNRSTAVPADKDRGSQVKGSGAKARKKEEMPITRIPTRLWPILALVFAALFVGIAFVLKTWTNSTVPWADSFTTALSIIALWMLARKWVEQWWLWFVVDAASSALYIYKGIYFYAGLYLLYTALAVYGYYKWRKMLYLQNERQETAKY